MQCSAPHTYACILKTYLREVRGPQKTALDDGIRRGDVQPLAQRLGVRRRRRAAQQRRDAQSLQLACPVRPFTISSKPSIYNDNTHRNVVAREHPSHGYDQHRRCSCSCS